jgi:hypothetical protein
VLASSPGYSREVKKTVNESLNGTRESIRFYAVKYFDVQLAPITGTELNQVIEFLDSCENGESFTWDFYGSVASPHSAVSASIDGNGYQLTRSSPVGQGGANDYFKVSFRVRVLAP